MSESHTIEGLGNKIDSLRRDVDARFDALPNIYASKDALAKTDAEVAKKASVVWFIGAIISVLGFQAGFVYFTWQDNQDFKKDMLVKIESISENSQITKEAVANIQGKLEPLDFVVKQ